MNKILHVVGCLNVGGAETMIMNIYRNINRQKYNFAFIVSGKEIGYFEEEVKTLSGDIHHITKWTESVIRHLVELYEVVKRNRYEVAHFHTQNAFLTCLEILIVKLAGVRIIITHSHSTSDWRSKTLIRLHKLCRRLLYKLTDKKLSCGKDAALYLFGTDREVTVVPLPVECSKYMFDFPKREEIREKEKVSSKKVYIHVGRFFDVKNHKFLIDVFCEIFKMDENSFLWLVGDGELRKTIEEMVNEKKISTHVKFFGNIKEVHEKLIAADIFVFPSKYEGVPTTVIEAQAAGLPCYISDTITSDIKITELVTQLSLTLEAKEWAEYIYNNVKCQQVERGKYNEIVNKRYGINLVVNMMERLYEM